MIDPHALIAARGCGEIRYAVLSDYSNSLSNVLSRFGLLPDASYLVEHDRNAALAILVSLLWKDMAYSTERMPRGEAEELALRILRANEVEGSRYYSNGNWPKESAWSAVTESTFDSGLIITGKSNTYFCIWFQDED